MRISDWSSDVCSSDLPTALPRTGLDFGYQQADMRPGPAQPRKPCRYPDLFGSARTRGVDLFWRCANPVGPVRQACGTIQRQVAVRSDHARASRRDVAAVRSARIAEMGDLKSTRLNSNH